MGVFFCTSLALILNICSHFIGRELFKRYRKILGNTFNQLGSLPDKRSRFILGGGVGSTQRRENLKLRRQNRNNFAPWYLLLG